MSSLQLLNHGTGSAGQDPHPRSFHMSPTMQYSAFPRESPDLSQPSMQLVPASPLRSPPLQPFDWWWDFVDFNVPQSPAILKCPSPNAFVQLLAPLSQKIDNYEDARTFLDLVISLRLEFRCPGCRVHGILSSLVRKYLGGDVRDPKKFEGFVGAAIQKLNEWMELSDSQFGFASTVIGAALHHLGRNREALPLLIEGLRDAETELFHNDVAQYRLKVALCHSELSHFEEAVEQLRLIFGSEFGRLAILAPEQEFCSEHDNRFKIVSKLMEYGEKFNGLLLAASDLDRINDVEIPAGTFCLEQEIIPETDIDETSTLHSTIFFSRVIIRRMDLCLLKTAGTLVRKLHLHNPSIRLGFGINVTCPEFEMRDVDG